jgi:nitrogen-specific signal transduction histidine kinase
MDNNGKHAVPPATARRDVTIDKKTAERSHATLRPAVMDQIMVDMVHEGRNALQQIQACCRLLEWTLDGDAQNQELFADLQQAQDRLRLLFDRLQGFAAPPVPRMQSSNASEVSSARQDRST